jgi:hypothetical protein
MGVLSEGAMGFTNGNASRTFPLRFAIVSTQRLAFLLAISVSPPLTIE